MKPFASRRFHLLPLFWLAIAASSCAGTGPAAEAEDDAVPRGGSGGGATPGGQGGQRPGGAGGSGGAGGVAGVAGSGPGGQGGEGGIVSDGQAGSSAQAGRGGGGACAGGALLCTTFEDVPDGALPSGSGWVARDGSCSSGSFSMAVSRDRAHGGTKSLKVTNHSWAQCRLAGRFDTVDEFWVRAWVFWDEGVSFDDKEILAIDLLPPSGLKKDDPAVRFGSRTKDPCRDGGGPQITIIGMGGGEQTGCSSNEPAKGQWHCFEAHIRQPDKLSARTFIDGVALKYRSSGKPETDGIETSSPISEKVNHIRLGFFTHNSTGMGNVYLDDVAVARTRIGCD